MTILLALLYNDLKLKIKRKLKKSFQIYLRICQYIKTIAYLKYYK